MTDLIDLSHTIDYSYLEKFKLTEPKKKHSPNGLNIVSIQGNLKLGFRDFTHNGRIGSSCSCQSSRFRLGDPHQNLIFIHEVRNIQENLKKLTDEKSKALAEEWHDSAVPMVAVAGNSVLLCLDERNGYPYRRRQDRLQKLWKNFLGSKVTVELMPNWSKEKVLEWHSNIEDQLLIDTNLIAKIVDNCKDLTCIHMRDSMVRQESKSIEPERQREDDLFDWDDEWLIEEGEESDLVVESKFSPRDQIEFFSMFNPKLTKALFFAIAGENSERKWGLCKLEVPNRLVGNSIYLMSAIVLKDEKIAISPNMLAWPEAKYATDDENMEDWYSALRETTEAFLNEGYRIIRLKDSRIPQLLENSESFVEISATPYASDNLTTSNAGRKVLKEICEALQKWGIEVATDVSELETEELWTEELEIKKQRRADDLAEAIYIREKVMAPLKTLMGLPEVWSRPNFSEIAKNLVGVEVELEAEKLRREVPVHLEKFINISTVDPTESQGEE